MKYKYLNFQRRPLTIIIFIIYSFYNKIEIMINKKPNKQNSSNFYRKNSKVASEPKFKIEQKNQNHNSSKIFKKLSMSFYNWATKNNQKQILCQNFNTSFPEQKGCRSLGSLSIQQNKSDYLFQPKQKQQVKGQIQKKSKQKNNKKQYIHTNQFNEYYFDQNQESPKNTKIKKKKPVKSPQFSEYIHYETPRQITQMYIRKYKNTKKSPPKHKNQHKSKIKNDNVINKLESNSKKKNNIKSKTKQPQRQTSSKKIHLKKS